MKNYNLLIVDDNKQFTDGLKHYYKMRIKEVLSAYSKDEATQIIKTHPKISKAIIDLILDPRYETRLDGIKVIEEIKKYHKDAEIIVVTAVDDKVLPIKLKKLGVNHFFHKPVEIEKLNKIILK